MEYRYENMSQTILREATTPCECTVAISPVTIIILRLNDSY